MWQVRGRIGFVEHRVGSWGWARRVFGATCSAEAPCSVVQVSDFVCDALCMLRDSASLLLDFSLTCLH